MQVISSIIREHSYSLVRVNDRPYPGSLCTDREIGRAMYSVFFAFFGELVSMGRKGTFIVRCSYDLTVAPVNSQKVTNGMDSPGNRYTIA